MNNADLLDFYQNNTKHNLVANFQFKTVSEIEVLKVISKIKSKAKGHDNLNIDLIELCCPYILPYLTHVINNCILYSVYPDCWKKALVVPLPKVNDPRELKDLRPISILPCLSKILEKIINEQLTKYAELHRLLPENQSGFRKNHGCSSALASVTDDIFRAADSGEITILALLDFSKAFDTLNHELLFAVLHYIGLSNHTINFFKCFFKGRRQSVKLGDEVSNELLITTGVPQGSTISPLLYAIYTSCLPNAIHKCKSHYYADDTQVYLSFKKENVVDGCEAINSDLQSLQSISLKHSLYLNPKKCCIMIFGTKNHVDSIKNLISIKIDDSVLPIRDNVKNLGVVFDSSLRFNQHISQCIQKAYLRLKLLYSYRHELSTKLKIILCDSLVLSIFTHGDVVYGNCLTSIQKRKIQKVQNSCLRLIYGIRKRDKISHKLIDTKWLNMEGRRRLHEACFYHKILLCKSPSYLYNKIIFRSHVHSLNIRFRGRITPPMHRSSMFERSFTFNVAKLYNSLPDCLGTLTLPTFRHNVFKYFFTQQTKV